MCQAISQSRLPEVACQNTQRSSKATMQLMLQDILNSCELIQLKRQSHPVTATSTKPSDAEGAISCEQCDEKFQSLWSLMRHRETQHIPALEQPVSAETGFITATSVDSAALTVTA